MRRTRIYSERTGSAKRRGKSRNLCRRGETTIKERRYDEDYATFFKGFPEYKGMLPHDQSKRRPSRSGGGDLQEEEIERLPSTPLIDQNTPCMTYAVWLAQELVDATPAYCN